MGKESIIVCKSKMACFESCLGHRGELNFVIE